MNKVTVIGRLARDNDIRYTTTGKAVLSNSVAVDDGFGDNKKTYFLPIVAWEKQAELLANYTAKGHRIGVTGKMTSRDYEDKQGNKRTVIEILVDSYNGIDLLEKRQDSNGGYRSNQRTDNPSGQSANYTQKSQNGTQVQSGGFSNDPFAGSSIDIIDDSLPF